MADEARPDAALGLEGVPHTGEAMTADGMLVEPQAGDFRSAQQAPSNPESKGPEPAEISTGSPLLHW